VASFFALSSYTLISMKLISYYQVNKYYRMKRELARAMPKPRLNSMDSVNQTLNKIELVKQNKNFNEIILSYPENLTWANMYYFVAAPTLCYEINFPRTERIRKIFIIKRVCEMVSSFNCSRRPYK
jgi:diacylglycerol O-acyltransferase-1